MQNDLNVEITKCKYCDKEATYRKYTKGTLSEFFKDFSTPLCELHAMIAQLKSENSNVNK